MKFYFTVKNIYLKSNSKYKNDNYKKKMKYKVITQLNQSCVLRRCYHQLSWKLFFNKYYY